MFHEVFDTIIFFQRVYRVNFRERLMYEERLYVLVWRSEASLSDAFGVHVTSVHDEWEHEARYLFYLYLNMSVDPVVTLSHNSWYLNSISLAKLAFKDKDSRSRRFQVASSTARDLVARGDACPGDSPEELNTYAYG